MADELEKVAALQKKRFIEFTELELRKLHSLLVKYLRAQEFILREDLEAKDLEARLAAAIELPVDVRCPCCGEDVSQPARVVKDGKVVRSIKKVYLLTEADILMVCEQDDELDYPTEDEMDQLARFIDKGYDPDGHWADVVTMAYEELERRKKDGVR